MRSTLHMDQGRMTALVMEDNLEAAPRARLTARSERTTKMNHWGRLPEHDQSPFGRMSTVDRYRMICPLVKHLRHGEFRSPPTVLTWWSELFSGAPSSPKRQV